MRLKIIVLLCKNRTLKKVDGLFQNEYLLE